MDLGLDKVIDDSEIPLIEAAKESENKKTSGWKRYSLTFLTVLSAVTCYYLGYETGKNKHEPKGVDLSFNDSMRIGFNVRTDSGVYTFDCGVPPIFYRYNGGGPPILKLDIFIPYVDAQDNLIIY